MMFCSYLSETGPASKLQADRTCYSADVKLLASKLLAYRALVTAVVRVASKLRAEGDVLVHYNAVK